jgi:hypothetical protein
MAISDGIPAVPRNKKSRNSVPNPSAEEKTSRNSVPWNKNRGTSLGMISESFRNCDRRDRHKYEEVHILDKYMINFAVRISEAAMRRDNIFLGCRVAHLG